MVQQTLTLVHGLWFDCSWRCQGVSNLYSILIRQSKSGLLLNEGVQDAQLASWKIIIIIKNKIKILKKVLKTRWIEKPYFVKVEKKCSRQLSSKQGLDSKWTSSKFKWWSAKAWRHPAVSHGQPLRLRTFSPWKRFP